MYYAEVTAEDLLALRQGLTIMDRLGRDADDRNQLFLYGVTKKPSILDAAKEVIAAYAEEEIDESQVTLAECAVVVPASSDTLYYLTGSGLKLQRGDEFVYLGEGGEGARSLDFGYGHQKPAATVGDFTVMALANDSVWIDKFLNQYGSKQRVQIQREVKRTPGETTTPQAPQQPVGNTPPAAAPGVPKQTSVNIAKVVEDFLGN